MSYENWKEVINDYETLLETGEGHDVIIYAGQNENVKAIRTHSVILRTRSQYFREELSKVEKKDGKYILKNFDILPRYLIIILRYIYCGKINLNELQGIDILKILIMVQVFDIQSLISCINYHMINHENEFLQQYEKLLETGKGYDVIIYTNQKSRVIFAHSAILLTRSPYFCNELSKVEKKDGNFILKNLYDISPNYITIILKYIYCEKIDLSALRGLDILKLLVIVKGFNIESLVAHIQEHLAKHQEEFLQQYEELLETGEEYDVIIYAGRNKNAEAVHAHSIILSTRSKYFCSELSKAEKRSDGNFILRELDVRPRYLMMILKYIYCDKIDLTKLQGFDILEFLKILFEYDIRPLIPRIKDYLIKYQYEFLQEDPVEILENIYQYDSLLEICNICLENICEAPEILFESENFTNLSAPILELLLKRDDLSLDEIDIWDNLIRWALAQHDISQDATKWNKEQIEVIEKTLHRYVPLIRFYDISSGDFFYKVLPYKDLLPSQLIYKIQEFHMVPTKKLNTDEAQSPPRRSKSGYDSVLIKARHFTSFANWIDKEDDPRYRADVAYQFNLLYRSSRDGSAIEEFHSKCDDKGANIVVIKIKDSNQIVGGYNPVDWSGTKWNKTSNSFIFFFEGHKAGTVGRVIDQKYAIWCSNNLLQFGQNLYGSSDIMYENGKWSSYPNNYPDINIPRNFEVDDFEVFQVVKIE